MIQVFINNEEVVADKNIAITEEMLSTPSTILNNVFVPTHFSEQTRNPSREQR